MAFQKKPSVGIAFLIGAATVAEFVAKDVSSPQTVHLNAKKRSETLMFWVNVGMIESAAFIAIAMFIDKQHAKAFLGGAGLQMTVTYAEYLYAKKIGMEQAHLEGTEDYQEERQGGGFVYEGPG
jgi:hypothetical protein